MEEDVVRVGYFWGYAWWLAYLCIGFLALVAPRITGVFHRAFSASRNVRKQG